MNEIAVRENGNAVAADAPQLDLEASKAKLAELDDPADVATVLAAFKAEALFQKARGARTLADDYTELAIYAEHALGSVRRLIPHTRGHQPATLDWDEMKKLHEQGLSIARIAKEMGCSRSGVRNARDQDWQQKPTRGGLSPVQEFDRLYMSNQTIRTSMAMLARLPLIEVEERIRRIRAEGAELTRHRVIYGKARTNHDGSGGSPTDKRRSARRAGRIKEPPPDRGTVTLSHVYQSVVQARERYSAIRTTLNAEQREELDGFYSSQDDWARRIANATMLGGNVTR